MVTPKSWRVTVCGLRRDAMALASVRKRFTEDSSWTAAPRSTLSATFRPIIACSAM